jgi:hypothetical protein
MAMKSLACLIACMVLLGRPLTAAAGGPDSTRTTDRDTAGVAVLDPDLVIRRVLERNPTLAAARRRAPARPARSRIRWRT